MMMMFYGDGEKDNDSSVERPQPRTIITPSGWLVGAQRVVSSTRH